MYTITAQTTFTASHALTIAKTKEPLHAHDWKVQATLQGPELDKDGLLIDFHKIEKHLKQITTELEQKKSLHNLPEFQNQNPSTERLAHYIFKKLEKQIPKTITLKKITLYETPTCSASYIK